jgi:division protein CdvB (Snf7/Vps24/ESCRT-III family)
MRYKNNVLDRLDQLNATVGRIQFQVNRNIDQDQITESIENLKEQIEGIRGVISVETDDFEQQFANR